MGANKIVIFDRQVSRLEFDDYILDDEWSEISIYYFESSCVPAFADGISSRQLSLTESEKTEVNFMVMRKLLGFSDLMYRQKTTFPAWEYHKFRSYFSLRNLMYKVNALRKVQFGGAEILYFGVNSDLIDLAQPDINIKVILSDKLAKRTGNKSIKYFYLNYLLRAIRGSIKRLFSTSISKCDILFIDSNSRQLMQSEDAGMYIKGHPQLEYLISDLPDYVGSINEVFLNKMKTYKLSHIFQPTKKYEPLVFGESIFLFSLFSHLIRKKVKKENDTLLIHLENIENQSLDVEYQYFVKDIRRNLKMTNFFIKRFYAYRGFFRKANIKAVFTTDENSPFARSILDAAKAEGVKTVGIQHGTLHELHPAYRYTKAQVDAGVLPDFTLVWGEFWKEFLIDYGNYPKDSLYITGQIRTDVIPNLKKQQKKLNYNKLVVFASQPQRDPLLRRRAAEDVFKACKTIPDVHLAVKLHPNEYEDEQYYRDIASQIGIENFSIEKQLDLYELIGSCDVLITCFSTVGTETVYFKKPLIILDHLKQDIMRYIEKGVGVQATDDITLKKHVQAFLDGERKINRQAYDDFIRDYAYKIDGKAAKRTLEFFKTLV